MLTVASVNDSHYQGHQQPSESPLWCQHSQRMRTRKGVHLKEGQRLKPAWPGWVDTHGTRSAYRCRNTDLRTVVFSGSARDVVPISSHPADLMVTASGFVTSSFQSAVRIILSSLSSWPPWGQSKEKDKKDARAPYCWMLFSEWNCNVCYHTGATVPPDSGRCFHRIPVLQPWRRSSELWSLFRYVSLLRSDLLSWESASNDLPWGRRWCLIWSEPGRRKDHICSRNEQTWW